MALTQSAGQESSSLLESLPAGTSLLDAIVENGRLGQTDSERLKGREDLTQFVQEALKGQIKTDADVDISLGERIKQIDELLSIQLNEIMHSPDFKKLEASWRGLSYLCNETETSTATEDQGDECQQKGHSEGLYEGERLGAGGYLQEDLRRRVRGPGRHRRTGL